MMFREGYYVYGDLAEIDAKVLQIPYVNTDLYLVILLPRSVDGLESMKKKLAASNPATLISKLSEQKVRLSLPKFKFEYEISLNQVLDKMGLKSMFTGAADFSGLLADQQAATISDVRHKAFIEVDEYGTEASAATVIAVAVSAIYHPGDPIVYDFNVDHPFMFAIKDAQGNIYFAGQVTDV